MRRRAVQIQAFTSCHHPRVVVKGILISFLHLHLSDRLGEPVEPGCAGVDLVEVARRRCYLEHGFVGEDSDTAAVDSGCSAAAGNHSPSQASLAIISVT